MTNLESAGRIAEQLRQEPYKLLSNDCITKSRRLQKECRKLGIPCKVVVCIGIARAKWLGRWLTIPVIHGWGEIEGKRVETSRPLGTAGIWSIIPVNIRPVITVKF
jgi:hypothetical protein